MSEFSAQRHIVAISGGKASAWCAWWAVNNLPKEKVVLYFNDTGWEHHDLYRFLDDVSNKLEHEITRDSDGRSPEELFTDVNALANNRMPFCSRILKAERLQSFLTDGDKIYFGIGGDELHRAQRIADVYRKVSESKKINIRVGFPLLKNKVTAHAVDTLLADLGIVEPELYKLGFEHNNCSGGCVRAGKKQWKLLLEKLPDVYAERERVENDFRKRTNKDVHFLKDETLSSFRERVKHGVLSTHYANNNEDIQMPLECFGICDSQN